MAEYIGISTTNVQVICNETQESTTLVCEYIYLSESQYEAFLAGSLELQSTMIENDSYKFLQFSTPAII